MSRLSRIVKSHRSRLTFLCLCLPLLLSACVPEWGRPGETFQEMPDMQPSIMLSEPPTSEIPSEIPTEMPTESAVTPPVESTGETEKPVGFSSEGMDASTEKRLIQAYEELFSEMGLQEASIGFAFQDLRTGASFSYHGAQRFEAASTMKLPVAMYSWEEVAAGNASLEEEMTVMEEDIEAGQGAVSAAGEGGVFTLESLLHESIIASDNTANHMILRFWQGRVPEGWLILAFDARYGTNYNNGRSFSAAELLPMLKRLYEEKDAPGIQILIQDLLNTGYEPMAALYLNVPVARKYGKLGTLYHDIGLAFSDAPFSFAVFTDGLATPADSIGRIVKVYSDLH